MLKANSTQMLVLSQQLKHEMMYQNTAINREIIIRIILRNRGRPIGPN